MTATESIQTHPWKWIVGVAAGVGVAASALTSSLDIWGRVESHWQTKYDALLDKKRSDERDEQQDKRIEMLILQTRLAGALLRMQILEDKVYECAARKAIGQAMNIADARICERNVSEFKQAIDRADALRRQIEAQGGGQ